MHLLDLNITSHPRELAPARRAVEALCASCGFAEEQVNDIGLCVNEAMANITRHAYAGATDRPVKVHVEFAGDLLTITLRDWGVGKDPTCAPPKHDPLTPGGLGMVCLRSLLDEVHFAPQPDGMLLTMKHRRR